jgi:hypothetical protein
MTQADRRHTAMEAPEVEGASATKEKHARVL